MTNSAMTKEIKFYEDTLMGVQNESGEIYLAVKNTAMNIGLTDKQAEAEVSKIQTLDLFKSNHLKFKVVQNEGDRQVSRESVFLLEKFVPMWLSQINITPKMKLSNPEACTKLLQYQLECVDILHKAFMGDEDKRKDFYDRFEINMENIMSAKLDQYIEPLNNKIIELSNHINKLNQKHDIFENPISLFARLQTNFNAKIYNRGSDGAVAIMDLYSAIRSYTGLHIPYNKNEAKQLGYASIKDYVIKVFGIEFIKMFDNAIVDGRIVRVKSGEFVDLSGVFQNTYEKDKIVKYFTGKVDGICKCGFCLTNVYEENEDYDFEHLINKSNPDSSDRIENIIIACKKCNKDKGGKTFEEWYPTSDVFANNRQLHIQKHIDKYSTKI